MNVIILIEEVENIVAKGEINCFEQFFLSPEYFQKSSAAEASMRERVKTSIKNMENAFK